MSHDRKEYLKKYRELNKEILRQKKKIYTEKTKEQRKEYRKNNPHIVKKSSDNYYKKHKDKILEKDRLRYKKNGSRQIPGYKKKWYEENKHRIKDKMLAYTKEYELKNREKCNLKRNKYRKKKLKTNINFKIACALRSRLCSAIKNNQKMGSAVKDLGCTVAELKQYLESLFQPGMTWDNWGIKAGQWSIDHTIPLSIVNLEDRNELLKVVHYTNLKPMWHIDNVKKGNKK